MASTVDNQLTSVAEYLIRRGRLDPAAAERAARLSRDTGEAIETVLGKLGLVSDLDLAQAIAAVSDVPFVAVEQFPQTPLLEDQASPRFLKEKRVLPIAVQDGRLILAMADPRDTAVRDALALLHAGPVEARVAPAGEIEKAVDRLYGDPEKAAAAADMAEVADDLDLDVERLKDLASEAPVIRLVNRLIAQAVELRASDIHLEPTENALRLRYRVDGVLRDAEGPPRRLAAAVLSRIKILAGLNIAERRVPQDGRIKLAARGTPIDLRVATIPTVHGESAVLRVLDRERVALTFEALGLSEDKQNTLQHMLDQPNGIVLVTGPTGSGKTTTLYAALARLNVPDRKIITVEDPVEYQLEGVSQCQVKPSVGLTFAAVLRAMLRHDPDILLVGEVRDGETAQIAAQAALTGHLVLTTLHTNDAAASLTRLLDMGLEDYLVTSTLLGCAAQRLVRRLCAACRAPRQVLPELLLQTGLERHADGQATLYRAVGCEACGGTGYRGRTAIMEVFTVSDTIRQLVLRRAGAREIERAAVAEGMETMYHDGLRKVVAGDTTIEEILRVTRDR